MSSGRTGKIELFNQYGISAIERKYDYPKHREEIISKWKQIYGKGFSSMYYHITPNIILVNEEKMELIQQAKLMKQKGIPMEEISAKIGMSKPLLYNWLAKTA